LTVVVEIRGPKRQGAELHTIAASNNREGARLTLLIIACSAPHRCYSQHTSHSWCIALAMLHWWVATTTLHPFLHQAVPITSFFHKSSIWHCLHILATAPFRWCVLLCKYRIYSLV